ncbi:MAG: hypothetical protein ACE5JI_14520 [Acidobacteriota bacterium]
MRLDCARAGADQGSLIWRVAPFLLSAFVACSKEATEPADLAQGPVGWNVTATADKTEVQVGEDLTVHVTVQHPRGAEFVIPTGAKLDPFELIERVDEPSTSPVETQLSLRMAAYRLPGEIAIPPIVVEYRDGSGELASIQTKPIPIRLVTSLTPDVTDIHDIKGLLDLELPTHWSRLWWLLAALLAAVLAYFLYRKFLKREAEALVETPAMPLLAAEEEAERALRRLAQARLLEQGKHKEFYTALAEITKRYAGRRFEVPYLERTTAEILHDLRATRLDFDPLGRLQSILGAADLVKFARVLPPHEDSQRMLPEAFRFVDETRPRPPAPTDSPVADPVEARP